MLENSAFQAFLVDGSSLDDVAIHYLNRLAPVSRRPGRFVALDQGLGIAENRICTWCVLVVGVWWLWACGMVVVAWMVWLYCGEG